MTETRRMTGFEATAKLLKGYLDSPNLALAARLVAAARMQTGIARQPQDLPAGLESAADCTVPLR